LSWKVKELNELGEVGRSLHSEVNQLRQDVQSDQCIWRGDNIPRQLKNIRDKVVAFITGLTRHQCIPATHVLVFMISNEERNRKPYALPVQCIPYRGISDAKERELANKVIHEMVKREMRVAGM